MCPECKSAVISDLYRGETTCEYCGLVISEKAVEQGHFDKNMFSREDIRSRGQNGSFHNLFIPNFYFHTIINTKETLDYNLKRIVGWDNYLNDPKSRNLLIAIVVLKQISSTLRLPPSVRENAMLLYRKALKKNLIRGRSIVGVVCASIYYACRKSKTPISFKEIIKAGCAKAKLVIKAYMLLTKEFNLKVPPLKPVLFVSRYINELQLSSKIEQKVLSILKSLPLNFINGKDPKSLIGAIVYLIGREENIKITQKTLAKMIGITEVTIRSRSKEIEQIIEKRVKK